MAKRTKQPVAKQPETYEEFLADEKRRFKEDFLRRQAIVNEPSYLFKVGEAVTLGALNDCRVEEVMEGGKVLHISYHDKGKEYTTTYDRGRKPRIVFWHEIDPVSTVTNTSFARKSSFRVSYYNTDIRGMMLSLYSHGIIDSPKYQRGYVWTLADKQRLIQSIFDGSDIGKFVRMVHPYPENRYEIIDGKQRIQALMEFMEGRFEFKGKTWFQLSRRDKDTIETHQTQYCELDSEQVKESDVLWLFLSINHAGVPQTEEHLTVVKQQYQEALAREGFKDVE